MTPAKNALCAATLLALPLAAEAATITPFEMAFFSFDTSGLGAFDITGSAFSCIYNTVCFEQDGLIAPNARVQVSFGTTLGGAELGTREYTNSFPTPINNAAGNVFNSPNIKVPDQTETLFASFSYVDDVYSITDFRVFADGVSLTGASVSGPELAVMPLSASGWMLLLGLGAFGVLGRAAVRKGRTRD